MYLSEDQVMGNDIWSREEADDMCASTTCDEIACEEHTALLWFDDALMLPSSMPVFFRDAVGAMDYTELYDIHDPYWTGYEGPNCDNWSDEEAMGVAGGAALHASIRNCTEKLPLLCACVTE